LKPHHTGKRSDANNHAYAWLLKYDRVEIFGGSDIIDKSVMLIESMKALDIPGFR
jgi:hypothetical protein